MDEEGVHLTGQKDLRLDGGRAVETRTDRAEDWPHCGPVQARDSSQKLDAF